MQLVFFQEEDDQRKKKLGHAEISYGAASSILTETSGFMSSYDYSINPYSGCSFGCSYCYAAFFVRDKEKTENWGKWIKVKENALDLLKKKRSKPLVNKTIYMSSVTDPYQPIEKDLELTRAILKELSSYHDVRLVIQTRGALVTRDIDLLKQFKVCQVNMTITTDSEDIRKVFEPYCPSNSSRLKAIKEVHAAGIQSCITMTPLLPIQNAHEFSRGLLDTGIKRFIIQPFHSDRGKFVAGTRAEAKELLSKYSWKEGEYAKVLEIIKSYIPNIGEGKEGFAPI